MSTASKSQAQFFRCCFDIPCDVYGCFTPARYYIGRPDGAPDALYKVCERHAREIAETLPYELLRVVVPEQAPDQAPEMGGEPGAEKEGQEQKEETEEEAEEVEEAETPTMSQPKKSQRQPEYRCSNCGRVFSSQPALGGHRKYCSAETGGEAEAGAGAGEP